MRKPRAICRHISNNLEVKTVKNESAAAAIEKKLDGVASEQGAPKDVGSEPPKNFGHGSASSAGTSGQIPKES